MKSYPDDTDEILRGLAARIEDVIRDLNPGGFKTAANRPGQAFLSPKADGNMGSFVVYLAPRGKKRRGDWNRFSRSIGGGPISLIAYLRTGSEKPSKADYADAFEWAREFLGLGRRQDESAEERAEREKRLEAARRKEERERAAAERKEATRRRFRAMTARDFCDVMVPIAGTLAEAYLIHRGIPPVAVWPWNPDGVLGFIPDQEYEPEAVWKDGVKIKEGRRFPALIARVQDAFDDTVAVWQIFLHPEKPEKNPFVEVAKLGFGPAHQNGGAVRLGGLAPRIGVAEGIETALGHWFNEGHRLPIWSTLSTGGMKAFEVPPAVGRVDLYPDGDRGVLSVAKDRAALDRGRVHDPPGITAARALAARLRPVGLCGTINEPPMNADGLDLWNSRQSHERKRQQRAHGS
jgi:hypothetical protein